MFFSDPGSASFLLGCCLLHTQIERRADKTVSFLLLTLESLHQFDSVLGHVLV